VSGQGGAGGGDKERVSTKVVQRLMAHGVVYGALGSAVKEQFQQVSCVMIRVMNCAV
jgi:hypothetical protein